MSNKSSNAKQTHTLQKQAKTLTSKHNKSSKTNNQINTDAGTASGRQGADTLGYSLCFLSYAAVTINCCSWLSALAQNSEQKVLRWCSGCRHWFCHAEKYTTHQEPESTQSCGKVHHCVMEKYTTHYDSNSKHTQSHGKVHHSHRKAHHSVTWKSTPLSHTEKYTIQSHGKVHHSVTWKSIPHTKNLNTVTWKSTPCTQSHGKVHHSITRKSTPQIAPAKHTHTHCWHDGCPD